MSEFLVPVGIIALLILLNGFFVAAEFAIVAAPRARIAHAAEQGSQAARHVMAVIKDPDKQNLYLATAQIGVTVASLGLGMYGEHVVADWLIAPLERFGSLAEPLAHTISTVVSIGLLTYLHVVVGEMVPKSLAIHYAEGAVVRLDGPMRAIQRIVSPVVIVLNALGNAVVRLLGIPPAGAEARLFSPAELEFLVEESAESGLMDAEERLYIENIFDLRDRTVGQVMTPRNHIFGIPEATPEDELLTLVCEGHHSRYPIYEQDLDHVIGVLHVKALARYQVGRQDAGEFDLRRLIQPVLYVPESLTLDQMLVRFRRERNPIAIVIDEFGGTAGLVTLEDLVEEVVGEILDEFDQELPPLEVLQPDLVRVRGDLLVDELNQLCDLALAHPEADTVGGLVMVLLGQVAQPGDVVRQDGATFEVEAVEGLAIQTVLVRLPAAGPAGDDDDGSG